jgi:hypothetical protein
MPAWNRRLGGVSEVVGNLVYLDHATPIILEVRQLDWLPDGHAQALRPGCCCQVKASLRDDLGIPRALRNRQASYLRFRSAGLLRLSALMSLMNSAPDL